MIEGSFIVLEGIDGAGTTTQCERLGAALSSQGLPVLVTREPTPGPVGSLLRLALTHRLVVPGAHGSRPPGWKTMALLFAADRLDHLDAEVVPNLMDGVNVISDRYDLSSLAYQAAASETGDASEAIAWITTLNKHARRPDLTIVLDVSGAIAEKRRRHRSSASELYETRELQARLAGIYKHAERLVPNDKLVHIDGERSPEQVAADVVQAVRALRTRAKSRPPRSSKRPTK
jgi:dTMP kinase